MLSKRRFWPMIKIVVAIIALIIATAIIFLMNNAENCLIVENGETGEGLARYPLEEGGEFSVRFKHSVNQSPVEDFYRIENGKITVFQTRYAAFGAGVQTELSPEETLIYQEDGSMLVTGNGRILDPLYYNISPVYDHILVVNGQEISLSEVCGKQRSIAFRYEAG